MASFIPLVAAIYLFSSNPENASSYSNTVTDRDKKGKKLGTSSFTTKAWYISQRTELLEQMKNDEFLTMKGLKNCKNMF